MSLFPICAQAMPLMETVPHATKVMTSSKVNAFILLRIMPAHQTSDVALGTGKIKSA